MKTATIPAEPGRRAGSPQSDQTKAAEAKMKALAARMAAEAAQPDVAMEFANKKALYFTALQTLEFRVKARKEAECAETSVREQFARLRHVVRARRFSHERVELVARGLTIEKALRLAKFDESTEAIAELISTAPERVGRSAENARVALSLEKEATALVSSLKSEVNSLYRKLYARTPSQFLFGWSAEETV